MTNLPSGTVTFLFTDIEGSTRRWDANPTEMQAALARHDELLRQAIEAQGGIVFKTVGDAFCAAFRTATGALDAALAVQRATSAEDWGEVGPVRVRVALHTGAAEERAGDYFGQPLNRVARILSAGHGGQTLLSEVTHGLVRDALPKGVSLRDLGEQRLKDLQRPERIFQLIAPDLSSEFPPLKTLDNQPNNLPIQHTPFIGREKEVGEVGERLRRPDVRLLTLTGPGGTGKTRLALQVAADLSDDFEHGVYFVNLAPISDPSLVASTIAQTLDVRESPGQPLMQTLKEYLREKQVLLLLDNFEQVTDAAAAVNEPLASATGVKVLVTSRVVLRVYGEHDYQVPALSLPDPRHLPPLDRLSQYEAVRLFIERAQAAKADFEVTNDNAPAVAEICARLDGLPLAIELAAARVRLLPPQAMLSRLQSRLKLLTGGAKDLPARQQTLRNTIEWSYDLLSEGEKKLFRRLAVFVGGRTLEAVEAVCNANGDLGVDVLEGVQSLVDKSLLQEREGVGGEPRFVMLETIHEFAREKLRESGESKLISTEHALYFVRLTEEAGDPLAWNVGRELLEWLDQLEVEHDNIRSALAWTRETNDVEIGHRLGGAVWRFWSIRGHLSEGRGQLAWMIGLEGGGAGKRGQAVSTAARARVLTGAGQLAWNQGDYVAAGDLFDQSLAMWRELDYPPGIGFSLSNLGRVAGSRGDHAAAQSHYAECLAVYRKVGNKQGIGMTLIELGNEAFLCGDYVSARTYQEQSLALFQERGDQFGSYIVLFNLAQLTRLEGDGKGAVEKFAEGLSIARELDDQRIISVYLLGMGGAASTSGEPVKGVRLFGASEALRERIGSALEPEDQLQYDRDMLDMRNQLSEEAFSKAWEEGRAMSMEEAIAYALEKTEHD
jgi:predicted ATPase/class 3 adenylate cyclase